MTASSRVGRSASPSPTACASTPPTSSAATSSRAVQPSSELLVRAPRWRGPRHALHDARPRRRRAAEQRTSERAAAGRRVRPGRHRVVRRGCGRRRPRERRAVAHERARRLPMDGQGVQPPVHQLARQGAPRLPAGIGERRARAPLPQRPPLVLLRRGEQRDALAARGGRPRPAAHAVLPAARQDPDRAGAARGRARRARRGGGHPAPALADPPHAPPLPARPGPPRRAGGDRVAQRRVPAPAAGLPRHQDAGRVRAHVRRARAGAAPRGR